MDPPAMGDASKSIDSLSSLFLPPRGLVSPPQISQSIPYFPLLSLPPSLPRMPAISPAHLTFHPLARPRLLFLFGGVASYFNRYSGCTVSGRHLDATGRHQDATGEFYRMGRRDGVQGRHDVVASRWRRDPDVLKTMTITCQLPQSLTSF